MLKLLTDEHSSEAGAHCGSSHSFDKLRNYVACFLRKRVKCS